ncbi:MAG: O-antigen ligase family protein [Acidimicrobiales bacterium]
MTRSGVAARAVAVLLIGCIFVVDPGGLAPSGPARFAALAVVLGIGAVVVGRSSMSPSRALRVMGRVWLALLAVIAASALTGADRWHGVFGTPERNLGLLTWMGFAIAFGVGASLPPRSEHLLAAAATLAVGLLASLAGLELLGFDPGNTAWTGGRVGAPFAQSTYLAVALVVLLPLAAAPAFDRSLSGLRRVATAAIATAGVLTLVATAARGPVLGLGVGVMVVLVARGQRWTGVAAVGAVACTAAVVSMRRGWDSFGGRIDEWTVGLRGVRASPLLGFGPEGYRDQFPRLVDADYVRAYGSSVITDRAHNAFIDIALSSGILAAALLGALWVLVGHSALRRVREHEASPTTIGLAAAVVAGLAQQLVLFPLAELDPMIWLFAGALVGNATEHHHRMALRDHPARSHLPTVVAAVGVVAMAASSWWNATAAVAEHRLAGSATFNQAAAEQAADRALALRPQSVRLVYAVALVHLNGPTLRDLDEALSILEAGLVDHPGDPALRTEYVFALVERARRSGLGSDLAAAVDAAERAAADAPNSPQLLGAHAEALRLAGRSDDAREQVGRALDLAPEDPELRALAESIEKS